MRLAGIALFLALASVPTFAQGAAGGKVDQKDVDAAIDKGATWLAGNGGFGGDHFELVMYTLFHSGTFPRDDKRFLDGVKSMQEKTLQKTYNVALTAMFLEAYDRVANQKRIAECAQFLVDNQCENGQWSYGEPLVGVEKPPDVGSGGSNGGARSGGTTTVKKIPIKRNRRGPPRGDHSNTQYAILGLRSCAVAEVMIPKETWKEALIILEDAQDDKGGWAYTWQHPLPNGDEAKKGGPKVIKGHNPSFGSMSAGCTGSLVICKYYLRAHYGEKEDFKKDKSVQDGLKWIAENFTVEFNPGCDKKGPESVPSGDKWTWHYYYLYALERAGMLGEFEFIGRNDWYQIGARYLLAKQAQNGMWKSEGTASPGGASPVTDTCFAILFLRRATKPVVPKTTSGR
ncbi:MAG: prenyltransferase/squalene [Planctomycetota bacterium]|nr:MAG: prenyltransferase/squalene [Planctomycetota bacterium]